MKGRPPLCPQEYNPSYKEPLVKTFGTHIKKGCTLQHYCEIFDAILFNVRCLRHGPKIIEILLLFSFKEPRVSCPFDIKNHAYRALWVQRATFRPRVPSHLGEFEGHGPRIFWGYAPRPLPLHT